HAPLPPPARRGTIEVGATVRQRSDAEEAAAVEPDLAEDSAGSRPLHHAAQRGFPDRAGHAPEAATCTHRRMHAVGREDHAGLCHTAIREVQRDVLSLTGDVRAPPSELDTDAGGHGTEQEVFLQVRAEHHREARKGAPQRPVVECRVAAPTGSLDGDRVCHRHAGREPREQPDRMEDPLPVVLDRDAATDTEQFGRLLVHDRLEAEPARSDRGGEPGGTRPDDGDPADHGPARARARAVAITSAGTGSFRAAPQRNSPGARSRSHHASRSAPGTQTSCRRCSIARNTAADTALGGSFRPRYAVGSSVLRQISVSMGPTWMTAAWMPEPPRSSQSPSVKPVSANFDAA